MTAPLFHGLDRCRCGAPACPQRGPAAPPAWRVIGDAAVVDRDGREVCTVDTERNMQDVEAETVARRIAALPELVEAARDLRGSSWGLTYRCVRPFSDLFAALDRHDGAPA